MSLVSCLPALERIELRLADSLDSSGLGCLLEALAWLSRLEALVIYEEVFNVYEGMGDYLSDKS